MSGTGQAVAICRFCRRHWLISDWTDTRGRSRLLSDRETVDGPPGGWFLKAIMGYDNNKSNNNNYTFLAEKLENVVYKRDPESWIF